MKQIKRLIKLAEEDELEWVIEREFRHTGSYYVVTIRHDNAADSWGDGLKYRHPIASWRVTRTKLGDAIKVVIHDYLQARGY